MRNFIELITLTWFSIFLRANFDFYWLPSGIKLPIWLEPVCFKVRSKRDRGGISLFIFCIFLSCVSLSFSFFFADKSSRRFSSSLRRKRKLFFTETAWRPQFSRCGRESHDQQQQRVSQSKTKMKNMSPCLLFVCSRRTILAKKSISRS